MRRYSKSYGFTLIELLIVIAIIGILAGLLFTNFSGVRERARDTRRKSDLNSIRQALQLYNNDFGYFPTSTGTSTGSSIKGCGAQGTSTCSWGSSFSAGNPTAVFMGVLPNDPVNTAPYVYTYLEDATVDFKLTATLENGSDPDVRASQLRCGIASNAITANLYMVCNQ